MTQHGTQPGVAEVGCNANKRERRKKLASNPHTTAHFVGRYLRQHGYGPSLDEIAMAFGLSNRASAFHHVRKAVEAGTLTAAHGKARSWRPVLTYHVIDDTPRPVGLDAPCPWPLLRRVW